MNYTAETDKKTSRITETVNILTILTFVGCGIGLFSAVIGYYQAPAQYNQMVQNQDKLQEAPAILKTLAGPGMVEIARKSMVNRFPILIFSLIGIGLCIYGALQMRTMKKRGFYVYLVGELIPTVTSLVFVGAGFLSGIFLVVGLIISLVFIALYANQVKHMS